ncbi:MAG: Lrp/AsnC family transcriptional regulator [Chloroflexota bacterium]
MKRSTSRPLLDSLDHAIIRLLQEDGRMSSAAIGRQLSLSEAAVRKRTSRLFLNGCIRVVAIVNPRKLGFLTIATIGLKIEPRGLKQVAEVVYQLPEVQYVAYCTGANDLMLEVWLPSNEDLLKFVTDTLMTIPGVLRTETTIIPKIIKSRYEFVEADNPRLVLETTERDRQLLGSSAGGGP